MSRNIGWLDEIEDGWTVDLYCCLERRGGGGFYLTH